MKTEQTYPFTAGGLAACQTECIASNSAPPRPRGLRGLRVAQVFSLPSRRCSDRRTVHVEPTPPGAEHGSGSAALATGKPAIQQTRQSARREQRAAFRPFHCWGDSCILRPFSLAIGHLSWVILLALLLAPVALAQSGSLATVGNPLIERAYATDVFGEVFVVLPTPLPAGMLQDFQTFNQTTPGGSPTASEGNLFHAYVLRPTGDATEYQVVFGSAAFIVPPASVLSGNVATFPVPEVAVQAGDVLAFYGRGIPLDLGTGADTVSYPVPVAPLPNTTITLGGAELPIYDLTRTYSFAARVATALAPAAPTLQQPAASSAYQVDLAWLDNAIDEDGFLVERSDDGGATWSLLTPTPVLADVLAYSDTTVQPNTTYAYRVFAFNAGGVSLPSNEQTVTTPPLPPPLAAPSGLVATVVANPLQVRLGFNDNSFNETGFVLERADNGSAFAPLTIDPLPPGSVGYTDYTVVFGHIYEYRVKAVNDGGSSAYSDPVRVGPPSAPTNLTTTFNEPGMTVAVLWTDTANNETRFLVQRSVNGGTFAFLKILSSRTGTGLGVTYSDPVVSGNIYTYRVRAENLLGFSDWVTSLPVQVGQIVAPTAPSGLAATLLGNPLRVRLAWQDNASNESGFVAERSSDGGVTWTDLSSMIQPAGGTGSTVTYVDETVQIGDTYRFRVKAVNAGGSSAYSSVQIVGANLPAAPSNFTVTAVRDGRSDKVTLRWSDKSNNETGFRVQRATDALFTAGLLSYNLEASRTEWSQTVARNRIYYYRIRAFNVAGSSAWSSVIRVTTP